MALHAAIDALGELGWPAIVEHDDRFAQMLRSGLGSIPGVQLLGPGLDELTLPVATFVVDGVPHALVAARLVRRGRDRRPARLLLRSPLPGPPARACREDLAAFRHGALRSGDRSRLPGAVRASAGINTTEADVEHLLSAIARIASGEQPPVEYRQDPHTGDFSPNPGRTLARRLPCARGRAH